MKIRNKIIATICVAAMILSSCAMIISAYEKEDPKDAAKWTNATSTPTDYAYSLAFVGDTQHITVGDYYTGSEKLKTQFKYIADTATERKLEHVFLLGDLTDLSYHNDANLAQNSYGASGTGEWEIVKTAVNQLNGVVPYSVNRGNHDDYLIDHYFNTDTYKAQFANGGFYADTDATYVGTITSDDTTLLSPKQSGNSGHKVYWNTVDGNYGSTKGSIVNSYNKVEIGGTKYLFMTIDYNPSAGVIDWVNETLSANPDYKAIITTHHFIEPDGEVATSIKGGTRFRFKTGTPEYLWENALSKHENVFMIVSGHAGNIDLTYSYQRGVNGNKVLQVMTNPQTYDTKETDANGTYTEGTQDTGMVLYMNFSEDGKTVTFEYYSTLLEKVLKNNSYTINLGTEASADANTGDVNLSNFEAYGQKNAYVTVNSTTAPTLNGAIGDKEYSVTKITSKGDDTLINFESDLTEYFAKDDDYIYYAFQTVRTTNFGYEWQLNLKPGGWVNKATLASEKHTRMIIKYSMSADGTVTGWDPSRAYGATTSLSYPVWNKDVFVSGSRDTETGMCTVEFKISRDYLEMNNPDFADIDSLGYMLYLHKDGTGGNGNQIWYRWNKAYIPTEVTAEMGTSVDFLHQYMVFDRDYIDGIETAEAASVRLSSEHSGLRFKTAIKKTQLNDLIDKYGKENISIGTLIAPTDLLAGKQLRHSIGQPNRDYIDVVATVGKPLQEIGQYSIYAGSISDIAEKNYEREFTAVGYIKIIIDDEPTYIYSDTCGKRSVFEVAERAYHDVKADYDSEDYKNTITDTNDFYYGQDVYSPYTEAQRKILYSFIANKNLSDPFEPDPYS